MFFDTNYESKLEIKISDNAVGIKITPIDSIFDKDLTQSNSTGVGLFIAKSILNMKLNGDISVENIKNGACFTIILNTH
jgi:two-component system, sensor histidine kinase LadS